MASSTASASVAPKNHIIANWKSFLNKKEVIHTALNIYSHSKYNEEYRIHDNHVILLPPTLFYSDIQNIFRGTTVDVGVQKSSPCKKGPYTGETTAASLQSADCKYCLSGHYERRKHFSETDEIVYRNIAQLLIHNITPIVCIGDTKEDYQNNRSLYTSLSQLYRLMNYLQRTPELAEMEPSPWEKILFVYEPIWAIGTGVIPPKHINEYMYCSMHTFLTHKYDFNPTILYGGSVNLHNLDEFSLFNGLLVGHASTNSYTFNEICKYYK